MRSSSSLAIFFLVAVLSIVVPADAGTSETRLEGVIKSDGSPVNRALVVVHDLQQRNPQYVSAKWETYTTNGSFTFRVDVGCYDLFVSARDFKPHTRRVCIRQSEIKSLKVNLKRDDSPIFLIEKD